MDHLIIYGDFNCPFSALASQRAIDLVDRARATVDWRAVEHDPAIPNGGVLVEGEVAAGFRQELDHVRSLLREGEPDVLRLPTRQVNTRRATVRYAGTPIEQRPGVRQALFAAHWSRGDAIDDDHVLDRIGAGTPNRSTAETWALDWRQADAVTVPVLVLPDGYRSRGLGALKRLAAMIG
ncbi:MAG: DsbA family protein [Acidimicrobiales bacterium]|nr:DsbA family protein [Actinomycetota bacterium]MCB0978291.1 DsbA family protein [Acidimicrobiales bacterium]